MEGGCVETALALLKKAGRMDLVNQEALAALRPARKAAQGIAAAVLACSPPCSPIRAEKAPRGKGKSPRVGLSEPGKRRGPLGEGEGSRVSGGLFARGNVHARTLDLCWQEENCAWEEPGEHRAALIPWREEQVEPRAAGRSSSTGGQAKRTLAADAPDGRCGGMGFAPAGAGTATSGEQHPGPSGLRWGPVVRLADVELRGEWQQKGAQTAEGQREDLWCEEECVLDFEERSFEEGELVDEGEEKGWWAHGGGVQGRGRAR
ncbi:hypothetical protein NDU88_007752 [Pleurodeles waltl]|uniref:Uncharacterized protein n=1 Tax=Pleurodeles waltl TaxID=8319 RepID=A0AAV7PM85_PLEWA|nr:hypothetical protein NDU88_007752 [Pleurodeles waltl]